MKTIYYYFVLALMVLVFQPILKAQATVVRFTVELPGSGISSDSAVYLAGSFNGWNPQDENYRMKRVDARHYQLDVPCFSDKNYEYKYTLGGWSHVERAIDDAEIENRKVFSSKNAKVSDVVVRWHVPEVKKEKKEDGLMASLSDEQKAKMAQVKDSLGGAIATIAPQLKELLGKSFGNLMSDNPDEALGKDVHNQIISAFSSLFENISSGIKTFIETLTPEQKKQLREKMKESDDPMSLFNMITK